MAASDSVAASLLGDDSFDVPADCPAYNGGRHRKSSRDRRYLMRVVHAQAERILKEYDELGGVPGFENAGYTLGAADEFGHADLDLGGGHASPEAFAKAAGIVEAAPVAPEIKVITAPQIVGLPNVGQYINVSAGVWEEPDPVRDGDPATTPSGVTLRWLYDGNEEDPVIIPEGDPHGSRDLLLPPASLGKTIQVRVTRGRTTVYSEPFGPIEGGLTEFTFPAQPVPDRDVVSAEPAARRRSGASETAPKRTPARAKTPTSPARARAAAKTQTSGKAVGKTGAAKKVSTSKKQALAKRAARNTTPRPAADPTSE